MSWVLKLISGSSLHGSAVNEPNKDPWGCRFDPWPHSVGRGSGITVSCGVASDLALLWLWGRPAAVAPIQPLVWELPDASVVALKSKTKNKKKTPKQQQQQQKNQPTNQTNKQTKKTLISTGSKRNSSLHSFYSSGWFRRLGCNWV